jgi:hypothetical protein
LFLFDRALLTARRLTPGRSGQARRLPGTAAWYRRSGRSSCRPARCSSRVVSPHHDRNLLGILGSSGRCLSRYPYAKRSTYLWCVRPVRARSTVWHRLTVGRRNNDDFTSRRLTLCAI